MSAVPVTIVAMIYPKNKTVEPYPATVVGFAEITGLGVGGGPIVPPGEIPKPPGDWEIWPPGPGIDVPEHPIVLPPDLPPVDPPTVVQPPHEGWNWSAAKSGWYYLYVPGSQDPQPKGRHR